MPKAPSCSRTAAGTALQELPGTPCETAKMQYASVDFKVTEAEHSEVDTQASVLPVL